MDVKLRSVHDRGLKKCEHDSGTMDRCLITVINKLEIKRTIAIITPLFSLDNVCILSPWYSVEN